MHDYDLNYRRNLIDNKTGALRQVVQSFAAGMQDARDNTAYPDKHRPVVREQVRTKHTNAAWPVVVALFGARVETTDQRNGSISLGEGEVWTLLEAAEKKRADAYKAANPPDPAWTQHVDQARTLVTNALHGIGSHSVASGNTAQAYRDLEAQYERADPILQKTLQEAAGSLLPADQAANSLRWRLQRDQAARIADLSFVKHAESDYREAVQYVDQAVQAAREVTQAIGQGSPTDPLYSIVKLVNREQATFGDLPTFSKGYDGVKLPMTVEA
jgi:hypothetical protein